MSKRIAVVGAGAIGSSVGADLTAAGLDVTIVDQWPAQVETMKRAGLRIVPELRFVPDRALERAARIDDILREVASDGADDDPSGE